MRPNRSFHTSLLFSPINLTQRYQRIIKNFRLLPVFGRPFAIPLCMTLVIIRMKVLPEKRMELSQTIASLTGSIRTEKGCKRCDFCQGMEDENRLFLLEEWDTEENLVGYLKSARFRVLRGAMNLLKEPYEMRFQTVFYSAGMEEI